MAVAFYLKLTDITGESQVANFKDQIHVSTYHFGGTNASTFASGGGGGSGKVNLGPLSITKVADAASGPLFLAMCTGRHITSGSLSLVKSGGDGSAYITVDLTDVMVTAFTSDATGEIPSETINLSYAKIVYTYKVQDANGNLVAKAPVGWDLKRNTKV